MNTNKSFKELSAAMQNCNLPQIDVTDKVMQAISRTPVKKNRNIMVISMAVIILMASGFGYAASTWKLFGSDGTVTMEYRPFQPGDEPHDVTVDLMQYIPKGEAALFYFKDSGSFISRVNEIVVTQANELRTDGIVPAPLAALGQEFAFISGNLIHDTKPALQMMKELEERASQSNDEFVFDILPYSDTLGYFATYQNEDGLIVTLDSLEGERWSTIYSDEISQIQGKLQLADGTEALYIEDAASSSLRIEWMKETDGQLVYYKLRSDLHNGASKEKLIELAGSL